MIPRTTTFLSISAGIAAALFVVSFPAAGQNAAKTEKSWSAPRAADGHPDLQGIWTNVTITPLERPSDLAGKEFFTEQEAADYEKLTVQQRNRDVRIRGTVADVANAYNDFWWDSGTKVVKTRRTSVIIDPPDGRLPALTPERLKQLQARVDAVKKRCERPGCEVVNGGTPGPADGPEDRPLMERCISFGTAGPPMMPSAYNNNYQLVQSPGFVAIDVEMVHDVRMIPIDGSPHLPSGVRQWMGDSRGRWEGDTLVVDTTNFTDQTTFRGSDQNLHLIERFTRTAPDVLLYRFTVDDPTAFTKPWTGEIPMVRAEGPLYEYACHEGNTGLAGILGSARADEKKAAGEAQTKSK
jgi:hypothetical protein